MNYKKIYDSLMQRALIRQQENPLQGYKEIHHILPKCLGGLDTKDNLVELTAREHFIAHLLLVKIYPNNLGLSFAVVNLSKIKSKDNFFYKLKSKNRLYEWFRIIHSNNVKRSQIGQKYYHNSDGKNIRLRPGDEVPEGFILGRQFSPTAGRKYPGRQFSDSFTNSDIQRNNANKRWTKYYDNLCKQFGFENIKEFADAILEIKRSTEHKWVDLCLEKYPGLKRSFCYNLTEQVYPGIHSNTKKETSWKGSGAGRKYIESVQNGSRSSQKKV